MGFYSYIYFVGLVILIVGYFNFKNNLNGVKEWLVFLKFGGSCIFLEIVLLISVDIFIDKFLCDIINFLFNIVD